MFPLMIGLAVVATPLIRILLTDKWLPCVPYMQIYCVTFAFYPVHSCNLQAINAIGRSDMFLKLEIIKKTYGVLALVIAVFCFHSPIAIAMTGLITTWLGWLVNAFPNKKLIGYSFAEQVKDLLPAIGLSVLMGVPVYLMSLLSINVYLLLVLQVLAGVAIYLGASVLFKVDSFKFLLGYVKKILKKRDTK